MTTPPPTPPNVDIRLALMKSVDGTHHVGVQFTIGPCTYTIGLPPDFIDEWVPQLVETAKMARRQDSGLIIAHQLPAQQNGHNNS